LLGDKVEGGFGGEGRIGFDDHLLDPRRRSGVGGPNARGTMRLCR
jgi:hypothetical protein